MDSKGPDPNPENNASTSEVVIDSKRETGLPAPNPEDLANLDILAGESVEMLKVEIENRKIREQIVTANEDFLYVFKTYESLQNKNFVHGSSSEHQQFHKDSNTLKAMNLTLKDQLLHQLNETVACSNRLRVKVNQAIQATHVNNGPAVEMAHGDALDEVQLDVEKVQEDQEHDGVQVGIQEEEGVPLDVQQEDGIQAEIQDEEAVDLEVQEEVEQHVAIQDEEGVALDVQEEQDAQENVEEEVINNALMVANEAQPVNIISTSAVCDEPWMRWRSGRYGKSKLATLGVLVCYYKCDLVFGCLAGRRITQQNGVIRQVRYTMPHSHPTETEFQPPQDLVMDHELVFQPHNH